MRILVLILLVSIGFAGCGGTGNLEIYLTDAPLVDDCGETIEQINVRIEKVVVVKKGSFIENQKEITSGSGVFVFLENAVSVNILDYQNGLTCLLGSMEIDEGDYSQLRLIINSADSTIKFQGDATLYPLNNITREIIIEGKIGEPLFSLSEDDKSTLVFDVSAEDSIICSNSSKSNYILDPSIIQILYNNHEKAFTQK